MKFNVMSGFRITTEALTGYADQAAKVRAQTPPGAVKPPSRVTWLALGAVYRAGDVIEVGPTEAAELRVVAPAAALQEVT